MTAPEPAATFGDPDAEDGPIVVWTWPVHAGSGTTYFPAQPQAPGVIEGWVYLLLGPITTLDDFPGPYEFRFRVEDGQMDGAHIEGGTYWWAVWLQGGPEPAPPILPSKMQFVMPEGASTAGGYTKPITRTIRGRGGTPSTPDFVAVLNRHGGPVGHNAETEEETLRAQYGLMPGYFRRLRAATARAVRR
jgi:hypothetical protein